VAGFFQTRRTAAVLKHGILRRYVTPFATKTGSTSQGGRVTIVDAYAGAGRYADGHPGSPELIVEALRAVKERDVTCFFVESDPTTYQQLSAVLDELDPAPGTRCVPIPGGIEDELEQILARASGAPLFLFLDPLGFGLPFERIAGVFDSRPPGRFVPATEVLVRIDSQSIYRTRGALRSDNEFAGKEAMLARLDATAGSDWWRDPTKADLDTAEYLAWFIDGLFTRLQQRTKAGGWQVELRHDPAHLPAYFLIFLTRHEAGMDVFSACLSSAQEDWRRAVFDEHWKSTVGRNEDVGQFDLFGGLNQEEEYAAEESARVAQWIAILADNLRALVATHREFVVRAELPATLRGLEGLVRETHIRTAMNQLKDQGLISNDTKGNLWSKRVIRKE
jgi:three-Cys-motif partner protein